MNNSKKINVSYSSLVGLKAELLRKQAEVQEARAKHKTQSPTVLRPKLKSKTLKQSSKTSDSKVTEIEDVNELKKSRYMLEAKSRLYEKLKKTHGDRSHNYLVDFSHKPISSSSSEDEIYNEEDYEDKNSDPEDDWVEYSDCFGRTRKCLRRDLPKMEEKDKMVKQEIREDSSSDTEGPPNPPLFIPPPKEPEIEKLRKKWEEQTEKLSHKPDIHYQDILFDEARAHGVGYYAFSQDEDERLKQQANLLKIRKETEERQRDVQSVNELKAQIEKNRLKAARIRQRIRAGLPAEPDEEEETPKPPVQPSTTSEPIENLEKPSKADEQSEDHSLCVIEDKIKAFAELLGKRPKFRELSQEEWIHKRRKDRMGEFAPVYENFKPGGLLKGTGDNQIVETDDQNEDPVRIKVGGPEPTDFWESQGPSRGLKDERISGVIDSGGKRRKKREEIDKSENNCEIEDSDIIGPVPPANFINSTLINNSDPPVIFENSMLNSSVNDASMTIIPPIEVLRSVPPPTFQANFNVCTVKSSSAQWNEGDIAEKTQEGEESDDSDIIGPLPLEDTERGHLADIPLPEDSLTPLPPTLQSNLNIDKISEGLKFLRKKFEKSEDS
ncbi:coiled-coil domain-containing protein 174 [Fopius arisanus]|uniref:Coiled-coil domain-containing protein 174 n=1 Tax=Fopius arisanus TaxID=64838 RepID=A0A9R1U2Q9_9HYME|nr:PREDICTED: coiled-coil domain-containing protein 174 [Fopius arisanus]